MDSKRYTSEDVEQLQQALDAERERGDAAEKELGRYIDEWRSRKADIIGLEDQLRQAEHSSDWHAGHAKDFLARAEAAEARAERAEKAEGEISDWKARGDNNLSAALGVTRDWKDMKARAEAAEAEAREYRQRLARMLGVGVEQVEPELLGSPARTAVEEWKRKFEMLNECHARTAVNGAKSTLDAKAEVERLRGDRDHYRRLSNDCALEAGAEQDRADDAESRIARAVEVLEEGQTHMVMEEAREPNPWHIDALAILRGER